MSIIRTRITLDIAGKHDVRNIRAIVDAVKDITGDPDPRVAISRAVGTNARLLVLRTFPCANPDEYLQQSWWLLGPRRGADIRLSKDALEKIMMNAVITEIAVPNKTAVNAAWYLQALQGQGFEAVTAVRNTESLDEFLGITVAMPEDFQL